MCNSLPFHYYCVVLCVNMLDNETCGRFSSCSHSAPHCRAFPVQAEGPFMWMSPSVEGPFIWSLARAIHLDITHRQLLRPQKEMVELGAQRNEATICKQLSLQIRNNTLHRLGIALLALFSFADQSSVLQCTFIGTALTSRVPISFISSFTVTLKKRYPDFFCLKPQHKKCQICRKLI